MTDNERRGIIYLSNVSKQFEVSKGILKSSKPVHALNGITLQIFERETLGIVGETGCGKTTLGRIIALSILPSSGDVLFKVPPEDLEIIAKADIECNEKGKNEETKNSELCAKLRQIKEKYRINYGNRRDMKRYRKKIQMVFQDPFGSLDPRKFIRDSIAEPIKLLTDEDPEEITRQVIGQVGLSEDHLYRFPHEFSGGQRQRIGIARAISVRPEVIVLDEPTSALDVSVQAQILNLLKDIQKAQNVTYVFISHNLGVVKAMADRVAVMYLGEIVELAKTADLFKDMKHPYTKILLSSIPVPDPKIRQEYAEIEGDIPNPANLPAGCYFHTRCPVAMKVCGWTPQDMGEPIQKMLDEYRNPEVMDLPPVEGIKLDEDNRIIMVSFSSNLTKEHLNIVINLVDKESIQKNGTRFKAINNIDIGPDGSSIVLSMIEPLKPKLNEVKRGHFVSCLLYEAQSDKERLDDGVSQSLIQR